MKILFSKLLAFAVGAFAFWKWGQSNAEKKEAQKLAKDRKRVAQKWANSRHERLADRLRRLSENARNS